MTAFEETKDPVLRLLEEVGMHDEMCGPGWEACDCADKVRAAFRAQREEALGAVTVDPLGKLLARLQRIELEHRQEIERIGLQHKRFKRVIGIVLLINAAVMLWPLIRLAWQKWVAS